MMAKNARVAVFEAVSAAALETTVNKFFKGEAVGAYADGFIAEKEFLDIQYQYDGATHVAMIVYAE
jgi:hypothetical protein